MPDDAQMSAVISRPEAAAPGGWRAHIAATATLAAPIAVAQLAQMAMGLTDTVLLGGIGERALAAGGLGANLFFTCLFALQGVLSGVAVLVARAIGAGRPADVPAVYWSGLAIGVALSVPFFWIASAPQPLLRWAGEQPALAADVAAYLDMLRWGVPAGLIGIGLVRSVLPALGLQRLLLWVIPAAVVVNGALNYGLIHGRLGLPAMGMRGSGLATAISLWITALALLGLLHGRRPWRGMLLPITVQPRVIASLLAIGLPAGATTLVEATLFLATGLMIGALGPTPLAAHMVALSVASVSFMVPLAISQAANVRVATAAGAANPAAARRAGLAAIGLAAAFMACVAVAMITAPQTVVALYLGAGPAAALAASLLRIAGVFQIADGIQVTASGALRGLKDTRMPMLLATAGYWGIGFFAGRYLAFHERMGAVGLWWGLFAGLAATAVCLTGRFAALTNVRPGAGPWTPPEPGAPDLLYSSRAAISLRRRNGIAKGGS